MKTVLLLSLALFSWPASVPAGESQVPAETVAALRQAPLWCNTTEFWGESDSGGRDSEYEMTCLVPPAVKPLVEHLETAALVGARLDPDARQTAYAALFALRRFHELPGPERMRFTLELARREQEPFASAQVVFGFGERESWKGPIDELMNRRSGWPGRSLGYLPAPFEREMTAALREHLFPKGGVGHPSTLACYLAKTLGDTLGQELAPDLQRVVKWDPKSLEATFAGDALLNLKEAKRFAEGKFDFATRVGMVTRQKNGCLILRLSGAVPRPGTTVRLVSPTLPQTVAQAWVIENPACLEEKPSAGLEGSAVVLSAGELQLSPGDLAIGVVAPPKPLEVQDGEAKGDLDRDGTPERFRECTSTEGVHLTVWTGKPLEGKRRWHGYYYLGYDTESTCSEKDWTP